MTTRRSERLRRKGVGSRQSTPGLTRPAAYTLYGSSYVCESEASIPTSSALNLAPDSKRARYIQSPHDLVETSVEVVETPKRRDSWLSAATRLNLTPAVETPRKVVLAVKEYAEKHHNNSHSLILLAVVAVVVAVVLGSLSAQKESDYHPFTAIKPAFEFTNLAIPAISVAQLWPRIRRLFDVAFGGAWRQRSRVLTQADWDDKLAPTLLEEVRKIAREESTSIDAFRAHRERYAADKGLPTDYALGSAGGTVLWTEPSTVAQYAQFAKQYLVSLVSSSRAHKPQPAETMLRTEVTPGECWWFTGNRGAVVIRLARPVVPTHVTIEHTPSGTQSAPKNVRVSVVPRTAKASNTTAWQHVGNVVYEVEREHMQTWKIDAKTVVARAVVFEIMDNHGDNFTCVYRLRVHGEAVPS